MNTQTKAQTVPSARCPFSHGARPVGLKEDLPEDSVFVDGAARELEGSEQFIGEAEANLMLRRTREKIYYWPDGFAGYCGRLVVREGRGEWNGGFHILSSRKKSIDLPEYPAQNWLKFQIEEMISHREPVSVSRIASHGGVCFGDEDAIYGRQVIFEGDRMKSYYRLKDDRITQIARAYGRQDFVINIDEHQDCGGKFAARCYTAFYRDAESRRLVKTETYLDRYCSIDGVYLPVERRYSEVTDAGMINRQVMFADIHVFNR